MKIRRLLSTIPIMIFILCIGASSVYGMTSEAIVTAIEKTGLGYYVHDKQTLPNGLCIYLINPKAEAFNTLGIWYYNSGFDEKRFNRVASEFHKEVAIEGKRVVFQKYRDNPDRIVQSTWYSEPFNIRLGADSKRTKNTYDEMVKYIGIITKALQQVAGESPAEAKTEPLTDVNIKIELEKNPATGDSFLGVAADGKSSLTVRLIIPNGFGDTIRIKTPQAGSFEGVETDKDIRPTADLTFTYKPPIYIKAAADSKSRSITEEIAVIVRTKDGKTKEVKERVNVFRTPVVLVHGFTGDSTTWEELDKVLLARGYFTDRKEYYYQDATGQSIPAQAHGLSRHIKDMIAEYKSVDIKINRVDVVAHSMGGLISRYYISRLDNLYQDDIRKLIMVGTPNHGCGDLDKLFGWGLSEQFGKHKKAAEQLYGKNPLIVDLNKDEVEGKHIDPDVQYGIIYGSGAPVGGDGVVAETSALLNGVFAERFPGLTHSPAVTEATGWGPSLTLDKGVFNKIVQWLEADIPLGEFTTYHMSVDSVEGEAYLSNPDSTSKKDYWRKLDVSSKDQIYNFYDVRTGDGRLVILLKAGSAVFGYVEMDKNTELYFEYVSPNIARVNLSKGSARFISNGKVGKHFETVLKSSSNIQIVRGLNTDYVVTIGDKSTVYCLEGKVQLISAASVSSIKVETLDAGKGMVFEQNGTFTTAAPEVNPWWENSFYKPISFDKDTTGGNSIQYIIGIAALLITVSIFIIKRMITNHKINKVSDK